MNPAAWILAAVLPLAAPPKLLVNAQLNTLSAAGGLERAFRPLVTAQPQPAWIGYSVPLARGLNLGCEYVSPGGWTAPGVIHLEPPDRAIVLFHVEGGAVTRIRTLSPDCQIDAGGVPVHWLEDVQPAESTALLSTYATAPPAAGHLKEASERLRQDAVYALAANDEPGALDLLIRLARKDESQRIRRVCVSALARSKDPRATAFFNEVLKP